ncbi:MAG: flagellar assembly peptidoglycan hydrolase FlgJ [Gammaproteobacteria bacterium]|nr:MAG: flagellar assembly peptidoglycan hydrolase FlgJ [Gammaproteobacteria bacterium]
MLNGQLTTQTQFESARVYHDLNSLNQLKGKKDDPETIREVAKQFESIFMGMMLKSMRDANTAIINEPMLDSAQLGMYQDMYDEQLTLHLGSTSGLGLTDILVQQLTGNPASDTDKKLEDKEFSPRRVTRANYLDTTEQKSSDLLSIIQSSQAAPVVTISEPKSSTNDNSESLESSIVEKISAEEKELAVVKEKHERGLDFSSPIAFVSSLWPYAQAAGKVLQLDPKMLIAQAALETGWGKYVMRTEAGTSSKNLFGIKASKSWQGETTSVKSLEVEDGRLQLKQASFRSYASYADSFNDYAQFINDKERYQGAVKVVLKPELYTQELQAAGYATDPNYANKINEIYNSPTLNNAIQMFVEMP